MSSSDKGQVVYKGNNPSNDYSLSNSHIFLPAAGCYGLGSLRDAGTSGFYWSSSLYDNGSNYAWKQNFLSNDCDVNNNSRYDGFSVRAVCK